MNERVLLLKQQISQETEDREQQFSQIQGLITEDLTVTENQVKNRLRGLNDTETSIQEYFDSKFNQIDAEVQNDKDTSERNCADLSKLSTEIIQSLEGELTAEIRESENSREGFLDVLEQVSSKIDRYYSYTY